MPPRSESPADSDETSTDGWYAAEIVNMRLTMPEKPVTKRLAPNGWVEVLVHWQNSVGPSECLQWQSLQHMCELGYDAMQHILCLWHAVVLLSVLGDWQVGSTAGILAPV